MYVVSQTFESLGDPCRSVFNTLPEAEAAADKLRDEVAEMVSKMETPDTQNLEPGGYTNESEAWAKAEAMAGVTYDDQLERTDNSPATWGDEVGRFIAGLAVDIETVAGVQS